MKKLTALISALALLLLCACSGQAGGAAGGDGSPEPGAASQPAGGVPPTAPVEEVKTPGSGEEGLPPADVSEEDASSSADAASSAASSTSASAPAKPPVSTSKPTPETTSDPPQSSTPGPAPTVDLKAAALDLIGHPVSELYAAIGQPTKTDYAPGCIEPDSEDGELTYSGFIVYTVRTASREYVYDVL